MHFNAWSSGCLRVHCSSNWKCDLFAVIFIKPLVTGRLLYFDLSCTSDRTLEVLTYCLKWNNPPIIQSSRCQNSLTFCLYMWGFQSTEYYIANNATRLHFLPSVIDMARICSRLVHNAGFPFRFEETSVECPFKSSDIINPFHSSCSVAS